MCVHLVQLRDLSLCEIPGLSKEVAIHLSQAVPSSLAHLLKRPLWSLWSMKGPVLAVGTLGEAGHSHT